MGITLEEAEQKALTEEAGRKLWKLLVESQHELRDYVAYTNQLTETQKKFIENVLGVHSTSRVTSRVTRREEWLLNDILEQGDYSNPVKEWLNENKKKWKN